MVISGGINMESKVLNDIWLYNTLNNQFTEIPIKLALHKHSLTPIFDQERRLDQFLFDLSYVENP